MPLYPGPGQLPGSTYPGDVVIDKFAPSITDIKRSPGVPKSTDSVKITYKATELNVGAMIDSTAVYFKVGSGSFIRNKVSLAQGDSLYRFTIPRQPNDSLVSYYVVAYSNLGSSGASPDPTVPLFYRIRDQGLTIYDVQWTPNVNGISGFVGDTVTVSGIITADTSDIKETGASSRPLLRFASKSGEWNAITIYGTTADVGIDTLMRGDSIQVTVVVRERFSRTELQVLSRTFVQRGVTVPAASVISISGSGSASYELSNPPVDGNTTFEKWEGVLVQVNNAYVVLMNADNPTNVGPSNHFGEFFISAAQLGTSSARFGLRVNDNGTNRFYVDTSAFYTAKPANAILISIGPFGTKISSLKGIFDYSFSFYKLEPRKDDDFGTITSVYEVVGTLPTGFELSQNYPNPFNPITTVQYSIPVSGKVSLNVYNILGQHVATLVNEEMKAGTYHVEFDAKRLASGVYFYHLKMDHFTDVKKMVLLK